jgi:hypothetical protein
MSTRLIILHRAVTNVIAMPIILISSKVSRLAKTRYNANCSLEKNLRYNMTLIWNAASVIKTGLLCAGKNIITKKNTAKTFDQQYK